MALNKAWSSLCAQTEEHFPLSSPQKEEHSIFTHECTFVFEDHNMNDDVTTFN